ncbi:MAG: porin family protein [Candidatus Latescibacterota bacterium]|nr:MAG: porin family protein [Candidatus Latescibacterota bacterium]
MKHTWALIVASLIALQGLLVPVRAQPEFPANMHFIFLIDVSGSMEFSLNGLNFSTFDGSKRGPGTPSSPGDPPFPPADNSSWQRLYYVRQSLPVLGDIVDNILTLSAGGDVAQKKFAFAKFPGNSVDASWLSGSASTDVELRTWSQTEYCDIIGKDCVNGLDTGTNQLTPFWWGTPIVSALIQANAKLSTIPTSPENGKVVFLLTDGSPHPDLPPPPIASDVNIAAVGMGVDGAKETDYDFLLSITDPRFVTGVFTHDEDVTVLTTELIKTFFDVLEWETISDPSFVMTPGSLKAFDVEVTEQDRQLFFVTSWHEPRDTSKVAFTLEAPGVTLTPSTAAELDDVAYSEGATYLMYVVRPNFLADHLGTWRLRIDGGPLPPDSRQITDYFVGGASDLKVNIEGVPAGRISTGGTLPLAFGVAEAGTTIPNVEMRVELTTPTESPGNWFAGNKLTADELRRVKGMEFPGYVSDAFKKYCYLRSIKNVAMPKRVTETIALFDDGAHDDRESGDGVFGNALTNVSAPGLYRVRLLITGKTTSGAAFTRERVQTHIIEPNIEGDWTSSDLDVDFVSESESGSLHDVTFTPRDRFGNYLAPGHADDITITPSNGARPAGDLVDNLEGGYVQRVEVVAGAESPTVDVSFKDKRFPTRIIIDRGRCGFSVMAFVGYFCFDNKLSIDDAFTFALSLRKCVTKRVQLEAELAFTPTDDALGQSGFVAQVNVNAQYRFRQWRSVIPYAELGGGWMGFHDFSSSDDILSLNFGAGAKVPISGRFSLLIDARDYVAFDAFDTGTTRNMQLRLGVAFGLTQ